MNPKNEASKSPSSAPNSAPEQQSRPNGPAPAGTLAQRSTPQAHPTSSTSGPPASPGSHAGLAPVPRVWGRIPRVAPPPPPRDTADPMRRWLVETVDAPYNNMATVVVPEQEGTSSHPQSNGAGDNDSTRAVAGSDVNNKE